MHDSKRYFSTLCRRRDKIIRGVIFFRTDKHYNTMLRFTLIKLPYGKATRRRERRKKEEIRLKLKRREEITHVNNNYICMYSKEEEERMCVKSNGDRLQHVCECVSPTDETPPSPPFVRYSIRKIVLPSQQPFYGLIF